MARVQVDRAPPASSHRSSLIWVSSPLQKLVKSICQLKDQQDIFSFRYKTQTPGKRHAEGWKEHRCLLGGQGQSQKAVITFGCTSLSVVLLPHKAGCTRVCGRGQARGVAEGQLGNVRGDAW